MLSPRTALLSAATWLLLVSLSSAASNSAPALTAASQPSGKHFLWKVIDTPTPFYVLGSYHALRGSDYPLGAEIDRAIGECKRFVFEYDFEQSAKVNFYKKMDDASHFPRGVHLRDKVSPKTYALVQKLAKTRSSSYDDVKPWAIAFFMYGNTGMHDLYSYYGVENYVMRRAGAYPDIGGVETPEEHIHVLSDMSDIEGEVFLLQTMAYGDRHAKTFGEAVRAYKTGDVHALAHLDYQEERQAPYLVQRIITKRNANWIPRIEAELKSGKPTMIVVGARHLCGPYNVIDLLRKQGHKLEQL